MNPRRDRLFERSFQAARRRRPPRTVGGGPSAPPGPVSADRWPNVPVRHWLPVGPAEKPSRLGSSEALPKPAGDYAATAGPTRRRPHEAAARFVRTLPVERPCPRAEARHPRRRPHRPARRGRSRWVSPPTTAGGDLEKSPSAQWTRLQPEHCSCLNPMLH
jgi:hypothetical protein